MGLRSGLWERKGCRVSGASRLELLAIWRQLAQRYEWRLVDDEATLLGSAVVELGTLTGGKTPNDRLRIAVWRAYSALLYRGLRQRQERAAQELWLACVRLGLKQGWSRLEAEELAQETIVRMLEKLPTLRAPQGLLSWMTMILRTVQRERGRQIQAGQPLLSDTGELADEPADSGDLAAEVEQDQVGREVQALLEEKLPNELERRVLVRIVIDGDHPRDVA